VRCRVLYLPLERQSSASMVTKEGTLASENKALRTEISAHQLTEDKQIKSIREHLLPSVVVDTNPVSALPLSAWCPFSNQSKPPFTIQNSGGSPAFPSLVNRARQGAPTSALISLLRSLISQRDIEHFSCRALPRPNEMFCEGVVSLAQHDNLILAASPAAFFLASSSLAPIEGVCSAGFGLHMACSNSLDG